MGIMGVLLGGLFVLPLIASPIIQLFWLIALGALFINRWPGGRGPAWETGEEIPWPSAQDRLAPPADEEDEPELEPEQVADGARQPNPRASRKRKKKNRR
jgi:hypothetical protein